MKKIFAILLSVSVLIVCMAGCASAPSYAGEASYDYKAVYESPAAAPSMSKASNADYPTAMAEEAKYEYEIPADDAGMESPDLEAGRKLIRNAYLYSETTEFDASCEALAELAKACGGYISGANTYTYNTSYALRSANFTLRIPARNLDAFLERRSVFGTITESNIWQNDVTDTYFDIKARIESLETKRVRILALLEKAEDLKDVIELERELSNTIYELESMLGMIRRYDDQIDYSTVTVYISEVRRESDIQIMPKTLGERISLQFRQTIDGIREFSEGLLVFIIGASPILVILAVIAVIVIFIAKKTAARRAAQNALHQERAAQELAAWRASQEVKQQLEEAKKSEDSKQ